MVGDGVGLCLPVVWASGVLWGSSPGGFWGVRAVSGQGEVGKGGKGLPEGLRATAVISLRLGAGWCQWGLRVREVGWGLPGYRGVCCDWRRADVAARMAAAVWRCCVVDSVVGRLWTRGEGPNAIGGVTGKRGLVVVVRRKEWAGDVAVM